MKEVKENIENISAPNNLKKIIKNNEAGKSNN